MRRTTVTDRRTDFDELVARLRRLEDDRDIRQLIASYGPAVDAGDANAAARIMQRSEIDFRAGLAPQ